jgi:CHAD domain-containing protein
VTADARRLLTARLTAVRDRFTRVVEAAAENPEYVHKFRVATRRATAAVEVFADYLPGKAYRQVKRGLRDLRRAAGAARDWDVFFATVLAWGADRPDAERPGLDALLGWAAAKRDTARPALDALGEDHPQAIDRLTADTVDAVRRPKQGKRTTCLELIRTRLDELLAAFTAAAAGETEDDAQLHQVRILGKRLRYTGELLAEGVPFASPERTVPMLTELQDVLGRYNDGVVAGGHLDEFAAHYRTFHPTEWERVRAGVDALLSHYQGVREAERPRFHDWRGKWAEAISSGNPPEPGEHDRG